MSGWREFRGQALDTSVVSSLRKRVGMWTEDKTDATQQNSPDSQSLLLGLLTGQTIDRRSAGSRRTRRRSTRWRRTGRRRTDSVSSRRGDRALANYYRARGRSYYFTWVTFHRGARTTIRQRRRSRTSRRFRRPVRHWQRVRKDWGEAYMLRRTMARPQ